MPRLLVLGHVTWDERDGAEVLGGSASYAAIVALGMGWDVGLATAAARDFDPARDLPGVSVFNTDSAETTRFKNDYDDSGARRQRLIARATRVDAELVPETWRAPDVLLLAPIAGELAPGPAGAFSAQLVGAFAQGWLRQFADDGRVTRKPWIQPEGDLAGVGFLFASLEDLGDDAEAARRLLPLVKMLALTRGREGVDLIGRAEPPLRVATLERPEVDPTGAGDVFGAAFLARYHETRDVEAAARFGCAAASCAVEGVGTRAIPNRATIEARLLQLPARGEA